MTLLLRQNYTNQQINLMDNEKNKKENRKAKLNSGNVARGRETASLSANL